MSKKQVTSGTKAKKTIVNIIIHGILKSTTENVFVVKRSFIIKNLYIISKYIIRNDHHSIILNLLFINPLFF